MNLTNAKSRVMSAAERNCYKRFNKCRSSKYFYQEQDDKHQLMVYTYLHNDSGQFIHAHQRKNKFVMQRQTTFMD